MSPRELEATILIKAATRLQAIRDDWDGRRGELDDALTYNRKLWTLLVGSVTGPENPLPAPVRQNVANLGIFVLGHTMSVMSAPAPERLGVLITINRELAAGLRAARPAAA
ncbi:MAG TPA: flagellar biosynthesis regulator FlaF [Beijerinckiaceae bacterium]|nr:flagellar biosynthesis regulator FlaF [Beijerinckiaceae bacterium]